MTDKETAAELVKRGIIGANEFNGSNLVEILVQRGIAGADEFTSKSPWEVLKGRGII